ncbi:MAG: T9SS type A sorting domain-containing protein [Bacteroidia bacterium]
MIAFKSLPLLILFIGIAFQTFSQDKNHERLPVKIWEREFSEGTYEGPSEVMDVAGDSARNYYYTGYFTSPNGGYDMALVKTGGDGSVIWKKRIPGEGIHWNSGLKIQIGAQGNIYVLGMLFLNNGNHVTLLKFNNSGELIWKTPIEKMRTYRPLGLREWNMPQHFREGDHHYVIYEMNPRDTVEELNLVKINDSGNVINKSNIALTPDPLYPRIYFDEVTFHDGFFSTIMRSINPWPNRQRDHLLFFDLNGVIFMTKEYATPLPPMQPEIIGSTDSSVSIRYTDGATGDVAGMEIGRSGNTAAAINLSLTNYDDFSSKFVRLDHYHYSVLYNLIQQRYYLVKWADSLKIEDEFPLPLPEKPRGILADEDAGIFLIYTTDSGLTVYNYDTNGSLRWVNYFEGSIWELDVWDAKIVGDHLVFCINPLHRWSASAQVPLENFRIVRFNKDNGVVAEYKYGESAGSITQLHKQEIDAKGNVIVLCTNSLTRNYSEFALYKVGADGNLKWKKTGPEISGYYFQYICGFYVVEGDNIHIFHRDEFNVFHRIIFAPDGSLKEDKTLQAFSSPTAFHQFYKGSNGSSLGIAIKVYDSLGGPDVSIALFANDTRIIAEEKIPLYASVMDISHDKRNNAFQVVLNFPEETSDQIREELWQIHSNGHIEKKLLGYYPSHLSWIKKVAFDRDGSFSIIRDFRSPNTSDPEIHKYTADGTLIKKLSLDVLSGSMRFAAPGTRFSIDKAGNYLISGNVTNPLLSEHRAVFYKFDGDGNLKWSHPSSAIAQIWYVNHDNDVFLYLYEDGLNDSLLKIDEYGQILWRKATDNNGLQQFMAFDKGFFYETWGYFGKTVLRKYQDPGINAVELPSPLFFFEAYPNPTSGDVTFSYQIHEPSDASLYFYDLQGRLLTSFELGNKVAGIHHFRYNFTHEYAQGLYLVRLVAGEQSGSVKVVLSN